MTPNKLDNAIRYEQLSPDQRAVFDDMAKELIRNLYRRKSSLQFGIVRARELIWKLHDFANKNNL